MSGKKKYSLNGHNVRYPRADPDEPRPAGASVEQPAIIGGIFALVNQEECDRVARSMITHGGGFVSALGQALQRADPVNAQKIKEAFPDYWETYKKVNMKKEVV